jgi:hypothetical protein
MDIKNTAMNVADFVDDVLGGTLAASIFFGVHKSFISQWKDLNKIPAKYHFKAFREAAKRGHAFDPEKPGPARKRTFKNVWATLEHKPEKPSPRGKRVNKSAAKAESN